MPRSYKKDSLIRIIEELPDEQVGQIFSFALFVRERGLSVKTVPAGQLAPLNGLVSWGGDAVEDAERLYE